MERETRVELATSTMARSRSTTELFPQTLMRIKILSNISLKIYFILENLVKFHKNLAKFILY